MVDVEVVLADGQAKVIGPDGSIWVINNATPEKKYKAKNAPTCEQFPNFDDEFNIELHSEKVYTQTEAEKRHKDHVHNPTKAPGSDWQWVAVDNKILGQSPSSVSPGNVQGMETVPKRLSPGNGQGMETVPNGIYSVNENSTAEKACDTKRKKPQHVDYASRKVGVWYDVPSKAKVSDNSVEVFEHSPYFTPYKSQLARQLSDELRESARAHKRFLSRLNWDWDNTIDLCSCEGEKEIIDLTIANEDAPPGLNIEDELADTADSLENFISSIKVGVWYDMPSKAKVTDAKEVVVVKNSEKVGVWYDVPSKAKVMDAKEVVVVKTSEKVSDNSVEVFEHSPYFSPYKSQLARQLSDELRESARAHKRFLSRLNWDWDNTIDMCLSEREKEIIDLTIANEDAQPDLNIEDELADTTYSLENFISNIKVPEIKLRSLAVERLPFHEEGRNRVYFRDDDDIGSVAQRRTAAMSKFTGWLQANRLYPEGRCLTYRDYPTMFTWHDKEREWRPRKSGISIGRIYFVCPSMGERYYLRMLLNHVRGPLSLEDIRTVDGVLHPMYRSACKALNLLGDDIEWVESIHEASQWKLGNQLRQLFATILMFCTVTDYAQFFSECLPFLSEDIIRRQHNLLQNENVEILPEEIATYIMIELDKILISNGRSLDEFPDLPRVDPRLCNRISNRQILSVLPYGNRSDLVDSVINSSRIIWGACKVYSLKTNMRLSSSNLCGPALRRLQEFNKWLLDMGAGRLPAIALPDETEASWITIPTDLLIHVFDLPVESILSSTFPDLESNISDHRYLQERCVLCPTNDEVDEVNLCVLEKLTGELHELLSADEICESTNNIEDMRAMYFVEFLNTFQFLGIPNHVLQLKVGAPVLLLRNINLEKGLCNGTRLVVTQTTRRVIEAVVISGTHIGDTAFIGRIDMTPRTTAWSFQFRRRQFPLKVCFAMTINKSQGQTFKNVCAYLKQSVFTHGQLYVVASRVTSPNGLRFYIDNNGKCDNNLTKNIVYREVFQNLPIINVMSYHKISDLHPNVTDKWQINVMISRIWKSFNHISGRLLSIDMILSDEHGFSIHAKIPANVMHPFKDVSGLEVSVSLWGNLARQISDDDIRNHGSPNIVIVLCSCRVRRFKGSLCLWTTASSQLYIDLPVSVLHIYKNIHVDHVVFNLANQTDVGMHITSMSQLLTDLQEGVPKGTMYNIYVNVIGVDFTNNWNYKLVLNVIESGVQASFVLFDDSAIPFLGFTVDELIKKSNLEGGDNPEWVVDFLKELLLAREAKFRIKTILALSDSDAVRSNDDVHVEPVIGGECAIDEEKEFYSKISEEEMELADEAMWDPRTLYIGSNSSLTMVDASNEVDVVSPISVSVVNEVDTRDEDTSDFVPDVESGGSVGRLRPRRNVRTPVRYRT
ncbi:hypothetical protein SSX86_022378 [Deinandra increscens subsp. villosa]|uniref:ATP-dependent DNA helicase n=1 Tax=Deinandra increscens subsp. villosa TaxID=3103831 RepID=A0AAP0CNS8_9ASTR